MIARLKLFLLPYKIFVLAAFALGIFMSVFLFNFILFIPFLPPLWVPFLTTLWILSVWLYKFGGRVSVVGGLIFLAMSPFLLIFKKAPIAEKSAIWVYMFLAVGIGQLLMDCLRQERRGAENKEHD